jgi:hypothetical protein
VWEKLRALPWRARWADDTWREPFQLATGSVLYLANALRMFSDVEFHQSLRPQPPARVAALLRGRRPPRFNRARRLRLDFAKMHLASASLRLPAAVCLREAWVHCKSGGQFSRSALLPSLKEATEVGCCLQKQTAPPSFGVYMALVLAHRDEFAHGEMGDEHKKWHKIRGDVIAATRRCRVVEAQMALIRWLVDRLTM